MPIEIKCQNIARYDNQLGKYVHCGTLITARDDKVGTRVTCPKCGGFVEVVRPYIEELSAGQPDDLGDLAIQPALPLTPKILSPPPQSGITVKSNIQCINCHALLPRNAKECPVCGHELTDETATSNEPVGFDRWFREQLVEGESVAGVLVLAGFLGAVLIVLCVAVSVLVYGRWAILLGTPLLFIVILLAVFVLANRRAHESWLAAIRRVVSPWTAMLILGRAWSWRETSWPFRRRKTLDRRDTKFTVFELLETDGLAEIQVLDLEGTQVTDAALEYLRDMEKLRFLVVRRTDVTPDGVQQLQRARPNLWIWS